MHFSEDDLRAAFKRKDPGEGFTQRVMARVGQAEDKGKQPAEKKPNGSWRVWWKLTPAWTFAIAALLMLAFAWGGFQYSEYRHNLLAQREQQRLEAAKRQREEAEAARDQAILALRIARSKLNHVLEQAQMPVASQRMRRQRL